MNWQGYSRSHLGKSGSSGRCHSVTTGRYKQVSCHSLPRQICLCKTGTPGSKEVQVCFLARMHQVRIERSANTHPFFHADWATRCTGVRMFRVHFSGLTLPLPQSSKALLASAPDRGIQLGAVDKRGDLQRGKRDRQEAQHQVGCKQARQFHAIPGLDAEAQPRCDHRHRNHLHVA